MKKLFITTLLIICMPLFLMAQTPYNFNYQGVARDASGQPIAGQNIKLKLSIMNGATVVYSERQDVTTNDFGLFNVVIGTGTNKTGTLKSEDFAESLSLKVEMDPSGGTSFQNLGTTDLQAVPYATIANMVSATSNGGQGVISADSDFMYQGLVEGGIYRGYFGSYAGKNSDVDFGTGSGNNTGSVHLTIKADPKLTVDSIGRVGIGTRFPFTDVEISHTISSGNNKGLSITNEAGSATTNSWTLYTQGATGNLLVYAGNSLRGNFNSASGVYTNISDIRFKTNIENESAVLDKVMQLRPVLYNFKSEPEGPKTLGLIAQELQLQFPELVTELEGDGLGEYSNILTVDYSTLSVVALKAIQEQQKLIEALKAELQTLKAEVKAMKK